MAALGYPVFHRDPERIVDRATDRLAHKITNRVDQMVSGWILGCFISAAMLLILAGVGAYLFYKGVFSKDAPQPAEEATWDGQSTFRCAGVDHLTLRGVKAKLSGTGIEAGGNCQLELYDVAVDADVALFAGGNAQVVVRGGALRGVTAAIDARGNARVDAPGAEISGPVKRSANAAVSAGGR
jgi:hypothetical protein